MAQIETERLVLRPFTPEDWSDVQELAVDWKAAPGPEFDKWPTSEDDTRGLTGHFADRPERFYAVALKSEDKVIGLLSQNGFEVEGQMDLGHVILSTHQDDDLDREALRAMVRRVFENDDVASIVTHNAPDHDQQLAPLRSLGFAEGGSSGELVLTRNEWDARQVD